MVKTTTTTPHHHPSYETPPRHSSNETHRQARLSTTAPLSSQRFIQSQDTSIGSDFSTPLRPNQNPTRTNSKSLPAATEKALLKLLVSPQRFLKFEHICTKSGLYGSPNSKFRKKVQGRRNYLINLQVSEPKAFFDLYKANELETTQDQLESTTAIDEPKKQRSPPCDEVRIPQRNPSRDEVRNPQRAFETMSHLLGKLKTGLLLLAFFLLITTNS